MPSLAQIQADNRACTRCELRCGDVIPVSGYGGRHSELMLVGDVAAPEEELMGRAFETREGKWLYKQLAEAGIEPEACFGALTVRCVPGKGKEVKKAHINACKVWVWRELQELRPTVVLTLGAIPSSLLLRTNKPLKTVVGRLWSVPYTGSIIAPWYHPRHSLLGGRKLDLEATKFFTLVRRAIHAEPVVVEEIEGSGAARRGTAAGARG